MRTAGKALRVTALGTIILILAALSVTLMVHYATAPHRRAARALIMLRAVNRTLVRTWHAV